MPEDSPDYGASLPILVKEDNPHSYFTQIPNLVFSLQLTVQGLALYVYLKRVAGEEGLCWQSQRSIGTALSIKPDTVARAKRELRAIGLITIELQSQNGHPIHIIRICDVWARNAALKGGTLPDPNGVSTGKISPPERIQSNPETGQARPEWGIDPDPNGVSKEYYLEEELFKNIPIPSSSSQPQLSERPQISAKAEFVINITDLYRNYYPAVKLPGPGVTRTFRRAASDLALPLAREPEIMEYCFQQAALALKPPRYALGILRSLAAEGWPDLNERGKQYGDNGQPRRLQAARAGPTLNGRPVGPGTDGRYPVGTDFHDGTKQGKYGRFY